MSQRKTVDIRYLVEEVNRLNKESTCESSVRQGWNSFLEHVLMKTNNYVGFGYYEAKDVPSGHLPGIIRNPLYCKVAGEQNTFPDESRKFYYHKRN